MDESSQHRCEEHSPHSKRFPNISTFVAQNLRGAGIPAMQVLKKNPECLKGMTQQDFFFLQDAG